MTREGEPVNDEHNIAEIKRMKEYVIKFFGISLIIILVMMLVKWSIPREWYLTGIHPYLFIVAIYICTVIFGVIDNAIIIFDGNVLEDYFHHYFEDEMLSNITVNMLTACISLYIGACIQDIMGKVLRKKIDPTAEQYAIGLLLGGSVVILSYLVWRRFFKRDDTVSNNSDI